MASFVTGTTRVTLTNAAGQVITGVTTGLPLANIPFTPTVVTSTGVVTLNWQIANFAPGTPAYDVLTATFAASNRLQISFGIQTSCASQPVVVQSAIAAVDVCGLSAEHSRNQPVTHYGYSQPGRDQGARNASTGGGFAANTIFAGAGETLIWRLNVANTGLQRATNLFVNDQLPAGFVISATNPPTSSQSSLPPLLKWFESGGEVLNPGASTTLLITGSVASNACSVGTTNQALAFYGCAAGQNCLAAPVTSTVAFTTTPILTISPQNATVDQCSGGPIIINFANNGALAQNVVISYTLPAGLAYNGLAAGTDPTPSAAPPSVLPADHLPVRA